MSDAMFRKLLESTRQIKEEDEMGGDSGPGKFGLDRETIKRMDDVASTSALVELSDAVKDIVSDLEKGGFDAEDILNYVLWRSESSSHGEPGDEMDDEPEAPMEGEYKEGRMEEDAGGGLLYAWVKEEDMEDEYTISPDEVDDALESMAWTDGSQSVEDLRQALETKGFFAVETEGGVKGVAKDETLLPQAKKAAHRLWINQEKEMAGLDDDDDEEPYERRTKKKSDKTNKMGGDGRGQMKKMGKK